MGVKIEAIKYTVPGWIDELFVNNYLKDLDALEPVEAKMRLYKMGRMPLDELQPFVEAALPEQLEDGRYANDVPAKHKGGDELMYHLWNVHSKQDRITNILRRRSKRPFTFVPVWTPQEIEQRTRARQWNSVSWGAGSHAGCDIFALYVNVEMGLQQYRPAYEAAMATVTALQNAEDGMWGGQQNDPMDRVNGTMKVLARVHEVQGCYLPFADKVIDYVIDFCKNGYPNSFSMHSTPVLSCTMLDIVFDLDYAIRMTNYRRNDVAETAYELFPLIKELCQRDDWHPELMQNSIRRAALLCGLKDELGWPERIYRY